MSTYHELWQAYQLQQQAAAVVGAGFGLAWVLGWLSIDLLPARYRTMARWFTVLVLLGLAVLVLVGLGG